MLYRDLVTERGEGSASTKFVLPCQNYADKKDKLWLQVTSMLRDTQPVLNAVINKSRQVVVKHGTVDDTDHEYSVAERLFKEKIPNIMKYYCKFKCSDSINYKNNRQVNASARTFLCNGEGGERGFIVMPWYSLSSVESFEWDMSTFPALKSVLKQAVCAYMYAYMVCGFTHGDFHGGNVLIRKTNKNAIAYGPYVLPLTQDRMYAVIMDFHTSGFRTRPVYNLYMDIMTLLNHVVSSKASDLIIRYETSVIFDYVKSKPEPTMDIMEDIVRCIEDMQCIGSKAEQQRLFQRMFR
jgi:hypothetical protein